MQDAATLTREREATVQFSDVFGSLPTGSGATHDFDAVMTAQLRNAGRFVDAHFPIGDWPMLGDYAAVLLEHLRALQTDTLERFEQAAPGHPDAATLRNSLQKAVVVVVNSAPRRSDHHAQNKNGDEFYLGLTQSGVEVYAQLPYFRGLKARGLLASLHRIPNDGGVWPAGEQFRSSCVTQARVFADVLEPTNLDAIDDITLDGRLAYTDKFGNVRLEVKDIAALLPLLHPGGRATLHVGDTGNTIPVHIVQRMTDIPEGEYGVYYNPADVAVQTGPAYLEFVRRVSTPNTYAEHAYATLVSCVTNDPSSFDARSWDSVNIRLTAA